MPYVARQFDGIDDRLETGLNLIRGSTNNLTSYCWIQSPGNFASTLMGMINAFDADQRFDWSHALFATGPAPSSYNSLQMAVRGILGNTDYREVRTTLPMSSENIPMFVAYVNDVANDRGRFFWGYTADTIIEVSTADFVGSPVGSTDALAFKNPLHPSLIFNLGALGREFFGAQNYFKGIMDDVGHVIDRALTLEELKLRALCGGGAGDTYYWPIDGTDPEPGIATIHGTTVVSGICEPPTPEVIGTQLVTLM